MAPIRPWVAENLCLLSNRGAFFKGDEYIFFVFRSFLEFSVDAASDRRITELADVIQECGPLGAGKFVELRQPFFFPPAFSIVREAFCIDRNPDS